MARARPLTATRAGETAVATSPALALGVILSAQLLVVLNISIVNVALPSIQGDLDLSATGTQWLVTAYATTFGGLLMVGGRAGDLVGRRRLFLTGLTVFSIASLVGATSRSAGMLVAARAAQGVGAAVIAPTALAVLAITFPEGAARNRAIGMYGATASVGFVAGLLIGGVLVSSIGWRAVFWVNVPIGIAGTVLGWASLPADRGERRRGVPDVVGAVLVTLATATIAYISVAATTEGRDSIIIAVSASAFDENRERCLEAGADDFLRKPFRLERLMELLRDHLGIELVHEEEAAAPAAAPVAARVVPPPAEVASLLDLARRGNVAEILERARRLEQRDAGYARFAAEIRSLAERFQVKKLCQLLEEAVSA